MMFEVPLSSKILRFFELIPKYYFPIFTHIIILHILSLVWNALLFLFAFPNLDDFLRHTYFKFPAKSLTWLLTVFSSP